MSRKRKKKQVSTDTPAAEPLTPEQAAKNLSTLAFLMSHDVWTLMTSSLVTHTADRFFHQHSVDEQRKRFRTHPANNIIYRGLKALEERSIVAVSEVVKDEHKLFPHGVEIRNRQNVKFHRHALSHPVTIERKDPEMQGFDEAGRKHTDFKPAQIWDLQRSINEELKKHGLETRNDTIEVTYDMAAALRLILDLSGQLGYASPPPDALFEYLQEMAPKYQALLEAHPDGARDIEKEAERRERANARKERWVKEKTHKVEGNPG